MQCSPLAARCVKFASEFWPASKTTVMSAAPALVPAAAHTASYRPRSWPIMAGNWVTSGLLPG
jgi:hypothetical protein